MDDYSAGETIGFSAQLAAIYTELSRYSSLFCRARFGLSVTEYELLLCLWEAETPLGFNQLSDFLMLKTSTLWHMAPPLIDRSLLAAESSDEDRRRARLSLTEKGRLLAEECCRDLFAFSKGVAQESLPDVEYNHYLSTGIGGNLDILRGHEADFELRRVPADGQGVEFTLFTRAILERWRSMREKRVRLGVQRVPRAPCAFRGSQFAHTGYIRQAPVAAQPCVAEQAAALRSAPGKGDAQPLRQSLGAGRPYGQRPANARSGPARFGCHYDPRAQPWYR